MGEKQGRALSMMVAAVLALGIAAPASASFTSLPPAPPTIAPAAAVSLTASVETTTLPPATGLFSSRTPTGPRPYFGARYYAARTGRFTAVDPVYNWNENLLDPQRWNRYAYGRNNPLRYVDPDGRDVWDAAQGVANAFGSNFFGGAGRQVATSGDYATGQFWGDVLSIPVGLLETAIGAEATGGGAVGAPVSGGATLAVSAAGVAMVAQGGVAASRGVVNAGFYLAKNVLDRSGGGKTGRKLSKDRLANQQDAIDALRDERDALRGKANKTPEDKAALASKERELKRATDRLRSSEEHARKAQGSN